MKYVLLAVVGGEPVLDGGYVFFGLFVLYCLSHLRGGTTSLRIHISSARGIFVSLFGLPLPFAVFFGRFVFIFFFFSFLAFLWFFAFSFLLSFNVSGLLVCVCYVCLIQHHGMTLHCLLTLLRYDVGSIYVS